MTSRSSYSTNKRFSRGEDAELVPVRSGVLYGIETQKVNDQKTTVKREILAVPNITYYSNYTKVFFDFSDYMNNPEKADVKSFFELLQNGSTFTAKNSKWNNKSIEPATYDLSGTYTFTKIVDNIVFADVTSISSYNNKLSRYDKEYFLELPIIEFTSSIDKGKIEVKSYVYNHLGKNSKNSFSYLGARVGDYLQLQTKSEKYIIESIDIDNEGKETLLVSGNLGNSSYLGSPSLVTIHQKNINKIQLTFNNTETGKCEIYKDGTIVECVDSHTELQSKLREDQFNKVTTKFYPGEFCSIVVSEETQEITEQSIALLKSQLETLRSTQTTSTRLTAINSSLLSKTNLINTIFTD
jgi:hypothetical protein